LIIARLREDGSPEKEDWSCDMELLSLSVELEVDLL